MALLLAESQKSGCAVAPRSEQAVTPNRVLIALHNFIEDESDQPLLLVAEIRYAGQPSEIKTVCDEWDIWSLFFSWGGQRVYDKVLDFEAPDPKKRIEAARLIA